MQLNLLAEIAIRWSDPAPEHATLLRDGGITAVLAPPGARFEEACRNAGLRFIPEGTIAFHNAQGFCTAAGPAALSEGIWPGIRDQEAVASATAGVWVNANGWREGR